MEGLKTSLSIFPNILGMIFAVNLLIQSGFVKETDVRFNKGPNCYVIVESVSYGKKTKIAYHIAR